ncbi:mitochondrial import inner membrane translocase subunit TIM14 [Cotesia typhae]|uniref:mitochondrial import inner membrane translocase subunit TIM14 n=1 Tax=Cotesia typhae TaxID=2053667 RepID=UPI003D693593
MASAAVVAGIGLAIVGFTGRYIVKSMPTLSKKMAEAYKVLPKLDAKSLANSKYYKGGFEPTMTKREASLILGVSPTASKSKIKERYKKLIVLNHPDCQGSPYLASKISQAKDLLEKK